MRTASFVADGRKSRYPLPKDFLMLEAVDVLARGVVWSASRWGAGLRPAWASGRFFYALDGDCIRFLPRLKRPEAVRLYYHPKAKRRRRG